MKKLYYAILRYLNIAFNSENILLISRNFTNEELGELVFRHNGEFQYLGKGDFNLHCYLRVKVEIEIIKCSNPHGWYRDHIGATFKYDREFPHTETHIVLMRDKFFKHTFYLAPREDCKLSIS